MAKRTLVHSTGSEGHGIVRLVACPSTFRVVFDPRPVYVRCVFDKAIQGQVLRVFRLFPVNIVSHLFPTHLRLHVDLSRKDSRGRSESSALSEIGGALD